MQLEQEPNTGVRGDRQFVATNHAHTICAYRVSAVNNSVAQSHLAFDYQLSAICIWLSAFSFRHLAYSLQLAAFGIWLLAYSLQLTAYSLQLAAFGIWHLAFGLQLTAYSLQLLSYLLKTKNGNTVWNECGRGREYTK